MNNKNQKSPGHEYTKSGSTDDADDLSEEDASGVRDPEILKFNSSIHVETGVSGSPKKVFTYYWRIKDMDYKLAGERGNVCIASDEKHVSFSNQRSLLISNRKTNLKRKKSVALRHKFLATLTLENFPPFSFSITLIISRVMHVCLFGFDFVTH